MSRTRGAGRRVLAVSVLTVLTALTALTAGCGAATDEPAASVVPAAGGTSGAAAEDTDLPGGDAPPSGWRYESYQDIRVTVPDGWGYGTAGRAWCTRTDDEEPFVGRPGAITEVGCANDADGVDEEHSVDSGGQFIWFGVQYPAAEPVQIPRAMSDATVAGDRATLQAGLVTISVQAPRGLRQQILDSITFTDTDHNGCPAEAPFADDPKWRPAGPPVEKLQAADGVSACNYAGARLVSSLRLTGEEATQAIRAIAAAPAGGGPNSPADQCQADDLVALEQMVLQVDAAPGAPGGVIGLRYGGCFHRGLDDGTTLRTLTRDSVQPFVKGPNRVTGWEGEGLSTILQ